MPVVYIGYSLACIAFVLSFQSYTTCNQLQQRQNVNDRAVNSINVISVVPPCVKQKRLLSSARISFLPRVTTSTAGRMTLSSNYSRISRIRSFRFNHVLLKVVCDLKK